MITAVTVVYNTPHLIKTAMASIRKFYPALKVIIIDGSPEGSLCLNVTKAMSGKFTKVIHAGANVGHGPGMSQGIAMAESDYVLVFDSDIEMLSPCLHDMYKALADRNVYGVGQVVKVDQHGMNDPKGFDYLHPHFALISKVNYKQFPPFIQHGAPCIKAMHRVSLQKQIRVVDFNLTGKILHKERGTRKVILREESRKARTL